MLEYSIVSNSSPKEFTWEVNDKLEQGWVLHGDTKAVLNNYGNVTLYQAFVREKR